ncbi:MAG: metalloregulator ArsR/SmtB family transcription factor [Thermoanaerobaculum sp.]|nr:metalloregulator ArsR/SmtB family transcription factor [Thermoanaerobaculum sp.]MDW7967418.1 metalloregulator ArsR/SmtB family transcription factor [Thermoanaerobaculum sp.]
MAPSPFSPLPQFPAPPELAPPRSSRNPVRVEQFRALADPLRLRLLLFLAHPVASCCRFPSLVCACDLEQAFGMAQPMVSYHMGILVRAGLVKATKKGRWVLYSLQPQILRELAGFLEGLAQRAEAPSTAPAEGATP